MWWRSSRIALAAVAALGVLGCSGSKTAPQPTPLGGVAAVTAGGSHACALLADGSGRCWGNDAFGQLGDGGNHSGGTPVIVGLGGIAALAAGGNHTCALLAGGTVSCFGDNIYGAIGNGQRTLFETTPMSVLGVTGASAIVSTGSSSQDLEVDDEYSCALLAGGQASCWGNDTDGVLGDGGTNFDVSTPVSVAGLMGARQLALGGAHACALLGDGTVQCWGHDLVMSWPVPTAVSGLAGVTALAAGSLHTCALLGDGTVQCWGDNVFGQRGTGATSSDETTTPAAVSGLTGVEALAAGGDHTCALLGDGTVQCWGNNTFGQLGDGRNETAHASPVQVVQLEGAVAVSAGIDFSCALLGDGTVRCWGRNDGGQLGNGATSSADDPDVLTPAEVVAGPGADAGSG